MKYGDEVRVTSIGIGVGQMLLFMFCCSSTASCGLAFPL